MFRSIIIAAAIAGSAAAHAQHQHQSNHNWVAPLIIGGAIGAVIANQSRPTYIYTPPPPVVYYPNMPYNGYIYRPMYKMVDIYIPECNCYRSVPVQIN